MACTPRHRFTIRGEQELRLARDLRTRGGVRRAAVAHGQFRRPSPVVRRSLPGRTGDEERDRQLVERGDEREEERRDEARADQGKRHVVERAEGTGAQARGALIQPLVVVLEHRHHRDNDEGDRQHRVAEDQAERGTDEPDPRGQVEQRDGDDSSSPPSSVDGGRR